MVEGKIYNFVIWATWYIVGELCGPGVDASIVDSVQKSRKLMTTDNESSLEDRLYDAMNPAIAQISEKNGFHTFVSDGNGLWETYDNQVVSEGKQQQSLNSLHGHSTTSDERIERVVVKTVEENWNLVKDVLNTSMDTSEELPRDVPLPPQYQNLHHQITKTYKVVPTGRKRTRTRVGEEYDY